jgi:hypothetical protein
VSVRNRDDIVGTPQAKTFARRQTGVAQSSLSALEIGTFFARAALCWKSSYGAPYIEPSTYMVATDNLVSFKTLELCSLAGALVGVDRTVGPSFMDVKKAFRPFLPLKAMGPCLFNCYEFCATDTRHKPLHHPVDTSTESTCWIVIFITLLTHGDGRLASPLDYGSRGGRVSGCER